MKRFLLVSLTILSIIYNAFGTTDSISDQKKESLFSYNLYGFIRNDFTFDSRNNISALSDLVSFIPMEPSYNAFGEDLNAIPHTRFLAITTRIGLNLDGPIILGAKSGAKMEIDFCGATGSAMMLRIRQAYFNLNWEKQSLLIGQTWHPMSANLLPDIQSLNAGAPFNAFNRSPMIRYRGTHRNLHFTAAAIWQFQYPSVGPNGASADYLSNGMVPELFLGLDYKNKNFMVGLGAEYVYLSPRVLASINYQDSLTTQVKVNESLQAVNAMFSISYQKNYWYFKAKSIYGQNSSHLIHMTGYGVTAQNIDGSREYAPLQSINNWFSIAYINKYRIALFGGYSKNLGSTKRYISTDDIYARGSKNIDQFFRITPSLGYQWKNLEAGIEYEYTGIMYGEVNNWGRVNHSKLTHNHRINAILMYLF